MKNNWQIVDDEGVIHSGTFEEIQLIWDLTTRSTDDLASEYRRTYSKSQIEKLKKEKTVSSWTGDLKLIEIYAIYR